MIAALWTLICKLEISFFNDGLVTWSDYGYDGPLDIELRRKRR